MLTVAYLANQFPSPVEPYVVDEIEELKKRGVRVITGSVRKPRIGDAGTTKSQPEIVLQAVPAIIRLRAIWLCFRRSERLSPILWRILFRGEEGPLKRLKALAHTWLGACYAVLLEESAVDHIHVHHGYFGAWIAMVAARLLGAPFSMSLHGSDLLLHGTYLDVKLESCAFCLTVSEYNRRFILERYNVLNAVKVVVARLGVDVSECVAAPVPNAKIQGDPFRLLAVGRLHAVKDHAFLVRACAQLLARGVPFECSIAGDGPEWRNLRSLIRECGLEDRVTLLGHLARKQITSWYDRADAVVLTSRSEGLPLVLMEAMARRKIVLAPAITGIPELVIAGATGYLYQPGSLDDFVSRLLCIRSLIQTPENPHLRPYIASGTRELARVRNAARMQICEHFNRSKNLEIFGDLFLQRIAPQAGSTPHENFVLQQI